MFDEMKSVSLCFMRTIAVYRSRAPLSLRAARSGYVVPPAAGAPVSARALTATRIACVARAGVSV